MLFTIIGIFCVITLILALYMSLNAVNERKRQADTNFDKYLTKNNIKTRFDKNEDYNG